jgi:hypothetical protein
MGSILPFGTFQEHICSHPRFVHVLVGFVLFMLTIYMFSRFSSVLWCTLSFPRKKCSVRLYNFFFLSDVHVVLILFVFIYVYWYPTLFPYEVMKPQIEGQIIQCPKDRRTKRQTVFYKILHRKPKIEQHEPD